MAKKKLKALIFAAGLGTRLQPLTNNRPKALVKVAGKAMLEHIILKLKNEGISEIIVNIHHFGDQIIQFLEDNKNFGCQITISDERDLLLDTGGGLKKAMTLLNKNENLLIHNVDIWCDFNLQSLIKTHNSSQSLATLLVKKRETSRYLLFHKENLQLKGWINKKTGEKLPKNISVDKLIPFAFSGIHIINAAAIKLFPTEKVFSIIPFYLNAAIQHKIKAVEQTDGFWMDLGKPEQLTDAEKLMNKK